MLNIGPPELPGLIGASSCRKLSNGPDAEVAAARRDDAGGDRAAETERIAGREHPVAHLDLARVAPRHRGQRAGRLHLDHRDIGQLVACR